MAKLWEGRSNAVDNRLTDDFNASIRFDQRLYKQDIQGSMAHAAMLGAQGINSPADTEAILIGLQQILDELEACGVFPIVYAVAGGREMFSYLPARCTRGMRAFLETRKNDRRANPVATRRTLRAGDIFYFTCIDEREKLLPLYEKYREQYHCVFQVDLYTREQWLEIMPKAASKASAALWLKSSLGCGRLVVFGDGENDVDLFEAADEAYAVANAADVLKAVATGVIGANDEDGVARWLDAHARCAAQTQGGV